MYEMQKGPKGYWWPYIDLMPNVNFFCDQDPDSIMGTQDPRIIFEAADFKMGLDKEWS
jgi:hypothetical protein